MKKIAFLHGFPDGNFIFESTIDKLKAKYQCYSLKLPGYQDEVFEGINNYEDLKGAIGRISSELNDLGNIHLVGHDWGGIITFLLASQQMGDLKSITIINAPHPEKFQLLRTNSSTQKKMSQYIDFFCGNKAEELLKESNYRELEKIVSNNLAVDANLAQKYFNLWSNPQAVRNMLAYYKVYFTQRNYKIPYIKIPVNFIWGIYDPFLSIENLDDMTRHCNVKNVLKLPTGHWPMIDCPEVVADFIDKNIDCEAI